jgi:rhodanese-related sulfurtransferase
MRTAILFIISALLLISCSTSEGEAQTNQPNKETASQAAAKPVLLDPAAFEAKLAQTQDAQLIDVRTPRELASGKLPACTNINFSDSDFRERMGALDKTKPVFVYCAVGGRSGRAASMLADMGFSEVYDLDGGVKAWQLAGKSLKK